ncbi:hypothetical protein ACLK1T_10215 [Escherichia coli]
MVNVARDGASGLRTPLLIGGATTSKAHGGENRADYSGPTVYVQIPSRPLVWWRRCFPIPSVMILSLVPARRPKPYVFGTGDETAHTTGHAGSGAR